MEEREVAQCIVLIFTACEFEHLIITQGLVRQVRNTQTRFVHINLDSHLIGQRVPYHNRPVNLPNLYMELGLCCVKYLPPVVLNIIHRAMLK